MSSVPAVASRLDKGVLRATSRSARIAQRERARREASRDERLRAKVETWVGERIRETLSATESQLSVLKARVDAKENGTVQEYQKLLASIQTFEEKLRTSIRDQAIPLAMQACRDELNVQRIHIDTELRSQLELAKTTMRELKAEQENHVKDFQAFRDATDRRIVVFEDSGWRETRERLRNLEEQFSDYVRANNDREIVTRRLEVLVKDLEGRNWPWRPHMDRSGSPGGDGGGAARSGSPNSRDPAKHCGEQAPQDAIFWRPWPSCGPIRPMPPTSRQPISTRSSRPSSRPSSAGRRRPDAALEGSGNQRFHNVSVSSAPAGIPGTRSASVQGRRTEGGPLIASE